MEPSTQRAPTKDGVGITQMFAVFRSHRLASLRAFVLLLAAALMLALLAAACDGGGDPSEKALSQLRALANNATEGATAKVTYQVITSVDDEATESEQIVVQRPPETRMETSVSGDSVWSHAVVINNGERLYVCLKDGGKSGCLDLEPSLDSAREALEQAGLHVLVEDPLSVELFDMPSLIVESTKDISSLIETSQRQIAGIDATCFTQEDVTQNLETELCFSDQGLTLYWRYSQLKSNGVMLVFEATATSVSSDVTDDDFVPPYKIQEGTLFEVPEQ